MKVFVVEEGAYEDRRVVGVYSTLEKAEVAHKPAKFKKWRDDGYGIVWAIIDAGSYEYGTVSIEEMELQ